jgi:PsbP-like protein
MRRLLSLALAALLIALGSARPAAAADLKPFESPEQGIRFAYPPAWTVGPGQPRGILPNELFNVRASADPSSAFSVVVYRLDAVITAETVDGALDALNRQVGAWVAGLPGGKLLDSLDVSIDDAEGRGYTYEYNQNGQIIHADLSIVLNGDRAFEIAQWARQADYDAQTATFDEILNSLVLPWSPPA